MLREAGKVANVEEQRPLHLTRLVPAEEPGDLALLRAAQADARLEGPGRARGAGRHAAADLALEEEDDGLLAQRGRPPAVPHPAPGPGAAQRALVLRQAHGVTPACPAGVGGVRHRPVPGRDVHEDAADAHGLRRGQAVPLVAVLSRKAGHKPGRRWHDVAERVHGLEGLVVLLLCLLPALQLWARDLQLAAVFQRDLHGLV
mmetsp:Transcript_27610/g.79613  ORF Transcript_27610/g.79613 Transcript_27610/m.79613 type:complete len:202 (+) Transcript_27610:209-814(+)